MSAGAPPSGYRARVAEQVAATIAEDRSDDGRTCVSCGGLYPCGPRRMAERAEGPLARKLQTRVPDGAGERDSKEQE
jgi:hypothetical protein